MTGSNKRALEEDATSPPDSASASKRPKIQDGQEAASSPLEARSRHKGGSERGRGRGRGRGGGRQNRNQEERPNTWSTTKTDDAEEDSTEKEKRLPKRKVAVLIGYCGTGYSGSQINPGVKTIEGAVFDAFVKAECVSEDNAISPNKVNLLRSARTDAGVHAAINTLSLKLILNPTTLEEPHTIDRLIDHLNSLLPEQIRIWHILRVQNSYNPRTFCDSRMYDYCLPTYVFLPAKPGSAMDSKLSANGIEGNSTDASLESNDPQAFWRGRLDLTIEQEMAAKRAWRIQPAQLEALRGAAAHYEGSHNFHNFTVAKDFKDRSAKRVMKSVVVSDPFMAGDCEWLSIKIHGQSFMLHQIRKMVGLLILLVRSRCPASLIPEAFGPSKIHIPKAPSLGLLLEQPQFDGYNKKVTEANAQYESALKKGKSGVGESDREAMSKETIEYGSELMEKVNTFKKALVYDKMWVDEAANDTYAKFLTLIDSYPGPDFLYLNKDGVIPAACVFVNGKIPGAPAEAISVEEPNEDENLAHADEG